MAAFDQFLHSGRRARLKDGAAVLQHRTPSMQTPVDRLERPMTSLRVSVTDRCNLRCEVLRYRAEYHVASAGRHSRFRGNREAGQGSSLDSVSIASGSRAASRCYGGDLPKLVRMIAQIDGIPGFVAHDQRCSACRARAFTPGRGATPPHREPRHAQSENLPCVSPGRTSSPASAKDWNRPRSCSRDSKSTRCCCAGSMMARFTLSSTKRRG